MLVALCSLKWTDGAFIDGVAENLLSFRNSDGSFNHTKDPNVTGVNQMSTEQAAYALVAYDRFKKGKNSLYDMTDVFTLPDPSEPDPTDPGNPDPNPSNPDPNPSNPDPGSPDPGSPDPGSPAPVDPGTDPTNPTDPSAPVNPSDPGSDDDSDTVTPEPSPAQISAPAFDPPAGIEAAGDARQASASELSALGFTGPVSEISGGAVTVSSSLFTAGLTGEAASSIDAEAPITPLPVFRTGVSAGGSALVTLKVSLDSYAGRGFGSVAVLKMKRSQSVDVLGGADGTDSIKPGEFVWTDAAGRAISGSDKVASGGEYYLNVAIKDNSDYDLDPASGTIVDPLALSAVKAAASGPSSGSGGGGCAAGAGGIMVLSALSAVMIVRARGGSTSISR
jgi:hypothetical protein